MAIQEVGEPLKDNAYKALKKLFDGFFQRSSNKLDPNLAEVRLEVQYSIIRLLFRFLFLLFAEGKGLLDLENEIYTRNYSFHSLKHEIANKKHNSTVSTTLWFKIKDLFRLINCGSESLGISKKQLFIPPYSENLFDPARNPNLERWEIGDSYLSDAIDVISRNWDKNTQKLVFIDYSVLNIQYLGNIYESLLEYELKIAKQDMIVKGKTNKIWVTLKEFNKNRKKKLNFNQFNIFDRVRTGEIYLATERGERKSNGVFYTPDNIINIIIRNTLTPTVKERLKEAKKSDQKLVNAILSIKVLDNAMGSGHFLLKVVDYLAPILYQALQQDIKSGKTVKVNSHTMYWAKRKIISHCIYGVDINDLAVELAKMALWFKIFDQKKTLNFLKHNIKQGNSLIGAFLDDLNDHISVKQDRGNKFDKFKENLNIDMLKTIADIRTSIFYGNQIKKENLEKVISQILICSQEEWQKLKKKDFVKKSRQISKEKLFFHWELEFPEVFYGKDNLGKLRTGFDVIIGNPPWASVRGKHSAHIFSDSDIRYLENKFPENTYMPNAYEYFILQSLKLLKKGGRHSYIVPDRLGFNESVENLRKIMLNQFSLDFLLYKVPFPNVIVDTLIYSLTARKPSKNHKIIVNEYGNEAVEVSQNFYENVSNTSFQFFKNKEIFNAISAIDAANTIKLEKAAETTGGFGGKSDLITRTMINTHQIEVVKGINVERYSVNGKRYFEFKKNNITGRTTDRIKLGAIPKILLRKTGIVLYSAYDDTGIYPEQSLYFLFNFKGKYSPLYLLSIINSSLFKFYYIQKLVTNRDTTPQLKKIHLDRFPIKKINFTTNEAEKRNLFKSFKELYDIYLQKGVIRIFDNIVNNCLSNDEKDDNNNEKNDILHNFLAFLAQNMTDFNKNTLNNNNLESKVHLTDKLIEYLIFKLYNLSSDNINTILEDLDERGIQ